jgi:hypothetical protein
MKRNPRRMTLRQSSAEGHSASNTGSIRLKRRSAAGLAVSRECRMLFDTLNVVYGEREKRGLPEAECDVANVHH